ncbi:MAG TPA: hypothetical protein VG147_04625 [Solirubrobacteraceae bacterium]|nr:hypothetical protein [Solirubrobacteraceae bacterium]
MEDIEDSDPWAGPQLRVAIARALLADSNPLTPRELQPIVGSHQSNIKKEADRMVSAGLAVRADRAGEPGARGPKAEAYGFSCEQRAQASQALPPRPARPGVLLAGQEVLAARADSGHIVDLLGALAEARSAAQASWMALVGDEILVVFDGPQASRPAIELLAVLNTARVPGRRATVARAGSADEWVRDAHQAVDEVRAAQARRRG